MSFARCAGADCGSVTMTASTNTITRIADFIFGLLSKIKTGADCSAADPHARPLPAIRGHNPTELVALVRDVRVVIEVVRAIAEEKPIAISETAAAIEPAAAIEIVIMIPAHLAHAVRRAGWPRHPAGSKRGSISNVRPRPNCVSPDKTASSESAYTACTATDTASHDSCTAPNEAPTATPPAPPH